MPVKLQLKKVLLWRIRECIGVCELSSNEPKSRLLSNVKTRKKKLPFDALENNTFGWFVSYVHLLRDIGIPTLLGDSHCISWARSLCSQAYHKMHRLLHVVCLWYSTLFRANNPCDRHHVSWQSFVLSSTTLNPSRLTYCWHLGGLGSNATWHHCAQNWWCPERQPDVHGQLQYQSWMDRTAREVFRRLYSWVRQEFLSSCCTWETDEKSGSQRCKIVYFSVTLPFEYSSRNLA